MGTVDIFKNKGGRFCCSYFYAKFFSKRRKSRDIPGTSANQTRRLPLTADQLFHRIRKGLPDVVCFFNCLWSLWKQLSVHSNMAPHLLLLCFFSKKLRFLISKVKRKTCDTPRTTEVGRGFFTRDKSPRWENTIPLSPVTGITFRQTSYDRPASL